MNVMPDTTASDPQDVGMPADSDVLPASQVAADLDEFDLDAFAAGLVDPTKTVAICRDRAAALRLSEVRDHLTDLEARDREARAAGVAAPRRAVQAEPQDTAASRAEHDRLTSELAASFVWVKVSGGLSRSTRRQAAKDAENHSQLGIASPHDAFNLSMLSMTGTVHTKDPRKHPESPGTSLTVQQWDKFTDLIGEAQYRGLIDAMEIVSSTGVSPDFSLPPSPSPGGHTSSGS